MGAIAFGVAAACAVLSALAVVRSANLVHAVLWLGVTLLTTAVLYAMLGASFLAGVQVLLYVGGVVTLMIFGVMVTRRHGGAEPVLENARSGAAAIVASVLFLSVAWAVLATDGLDAPVTLPAPVTAADLGRVLLRDHVLAFETISMLLLAAIIGAIVIARRNDAGVSRDATRPAAPAAAPAAPEAAE